jgi:predicted metalloprotease with PDZ domain
MCSSTISDDFVMLNGQAVFGYLSGMQSEPIKIKVDYPSNWLLGTALRQDAEGYYDAENYDKVVDSPFYLGNLTKATTEVGGAKIDVYTYSKTGMITSEDMLGLLKDILNAESDFTKGLPVNHYTFLFEFGNFSAGAWEHSYSSEYVTREDSLKGPAAENLRSVVAHEFFHVTIRRCYRVGCTYITASRSSDYT